MRHACRGRNFGLMILLDYNPPWDYPPDLRLSA
jgi:hypothetical protein